MRRITGLLVFVVCLNLVNGEPKVPCYFIFGDSYSDPGNNNNLFSFAKANYPPYGVDYPGEIPTGRFTNGLNSVDYIAQFLGFEKFISPYKTQMDKDILRGVNYASGSAGILTHTSYHVGDKVWMDQQLQNYAMTISKLQLMVNGPVTNYLNKCLYSVNIGTNDYINNYFWKLLYPTTQLLTADQYATQLTTRYKEILQILYASGARKVAVFGLGPLGCLPSEIARSNATKCVEEKNRAVQLFNKKLESVVNHFNKKVQGAKFTFINVYAIQSATLPGLITNSTCCKLVKLTDLCEANAPPCANRNLYAYMDAIHPTEVVNKQVAIDAYNSSKTPLFVRPMNISRLICN